MIQRNYGSKLQDCFWLNHYSRHPKIFKKIVLEIHLVWRMHLEECFLNFSFGKWRGQPWVHFQCNFWGYRLKHIIYDIETRLVACEDLLKIRIKNVVGVPLPNCIFHSHDAIIFLPKKNLCMKKLGILVTFR